MIYIDVGANDGKSTERFAAEGHTVIAFEPNPEMCKILYQKEQEKYPSLYVHPVAVSDYDGIATFNICKQADRGCSSLLKLSESANTAWGGRTDMFPSEQITVSVVRLDTYLNWNNIPEIEWFHCDAQGSDLAVLKGMGEFVTRIKAGVVEAAAKPDILYKGQNTAKETMDWLQSKGFMITAIETNDIQINEVNIYFKRLT